MPVLPFEGRGQGPGTSGKLCSGTWLSPSGLGFGMFLLLFAAGCATAPPVSERQEQRIQEAEQGLEEDARVKARLAAIEAARARERDQQIVDGVELRVSDNYVEEHHVRVMARVPIHRPAELDAQARVYRAETDMAVARLEETSLELRAELCFPSVEALAHEIRLRIYEQYASRQKSLLSWNAERQRSGLVSEIDGTRFDLESRIKLATREPLSLSVSPRVLSVLPEIGSTAERLDLDAAHLREMLRLHVPSVSLRQASAERYRALMDRSRIRKQPWIKFMDVSYDYRGSDPSRNGGGAKVAFQIPLGGKSYADVGRYKALAREQSYRAEGLIDERMEQSLQALYEIDQFELQSDQWRDLGMLALRGEEIADRWWGQRAAGPEVVAGMLDEAFAARRAVLDARERAGMASCTLLVMTGVPVDDWPRGGAQEVDPEVLLEALPQLGDRLEARE